MTKPDARTKEILRLHKLEIPMSKIGKRFNLSRQRIFQIVKKVKDDNKITK